MNPKLLPYCLAALLALTAAAHATADDILSRLDIPADQLLTGELIDLADAAFDGQHAVALSPEQTALLDIPALADDAEEFPVAVSGRRQLDDNRQLLLLTRQADNYGADNILLAIYDDHANLLDLLNLGIAAGNNLTYSQTDFVDSLTNLIGYETTTLRCDMPAQFDLLRCVALTADNRHINTPTWQIQSFHSYALNADGHAVLTEQQLRAIPPLDVPDERLRQRQADLLAAQPASATTLEELHELYRETDNDKPDNDCHTCELPHTQALNAISRAALTRQRLNPQKAGQYVADNPEEPLAKLLANDNTQH